jgi:hypothetical protein
VYACRHHPLRDAVLNPGSLTDEEAQEVAPSSTPSHARRFHKQTDYLTEKLPGDAVYYAKR